MLPNQKPIRNPGDLPQESAITSARSCEVRAPAQKRVACIGLPMPFARRIDLPGASLPIATLPRR